METAAYAGFWNRFAAAIIDGIVTAVGGLAIIGPIFAFLFFSNPGQLGDPDSAQRCSP